MTLILRNTNMSKSNHKIALLFVLKIIRPLLRSRNIVKLRKTVCHAPIHNLKNVGKHTEHTNLKAGLL